MSKKKFDLTSNLVDIVTEEYKVDHISTPIPKSSKQVGLNLAISEDLRLEFKTWCVSKKMSMNHAFVQAFKLLKSQYQSK